MIIIVIIIDQLLDAIDWRASVAVNGARTGTTAVSSAIGVSIIAIIIVVVIIAVLGMIVDLKVG